MITRRTVTLGLALLSIPGLAQAQQINRGAMEEVFNLLSDSSQRTLQRKLTAAGVYNLGIDGLYGPGTEAGLIRGAKFLMRKSNNEADISLARRKGVASYYNRIISGEFDRWIYK